MNTVTCVGPLAMTGEHGVGRQGENENQVTQGARVNLQPNRTMKKMKRAIRDLIECHQTDAVGLNENMNLGSPRILETRQGEEHRNNPNLHMEMREKPMWELREYDHVS